VHITYSGQGLLHGVLFNCIGQKIRDVEISHSMDIAVNQWPAGIYYFKYNNVEGAMPVKKIVVE
jgi:hypothetical protein